MAAAEVATCFRIGKRSVFDRIKSIFIQKKIKVKAFYHKSLDFFVLELLSYGQTKVRAGYLVNPRGCKPPV